MRVSTINKKLSKGNYIYTQDSSLFQLFESTVLCSLCLYIVIHGVTLIASVMQRGAFMYNISVERLGDVMPHSLRTCAGPMRQVYDKSYYMGLLRWLLWYLLW